MAYRPKWAITRQLSVQMAHVWTDNDRITGGKALGLVLALAGVGWALLDRDDAAASIAGVLYVCYR